MIEPITSARQQALMRRPVAAEGAQSAAGATQTAQMAQAAQAAPARQSAPAAQPARPAPGDSSGALSAMRTAQEVMQAVGTAVPSAENSRIANEAYQMEARAQSDLQRGRAGAAGVTREWRA